jgi:hypothetical protein
MKRRTFLATATAGVLASQARAANPETEFGPARLLTIVPDVGPSTDPAVLQATLQALVERRLPSCIIVHRFDGASTGLSPDMPLAGILRSFSARAPGLIEIVAWAPVLGRKRPFEVARAAMESRSALVSSVWGTGQDEVPSTAIVSIATDFAAEQFSVGDVISAGFRNVIILPQRSASPDARLDPNGVLTVLGGTRTNLEDAEALVLQAQANTQVKLILPIATFEKQGLVGIGAAVSRLATTIHSQELAGRVTTLLLRDLLLRTDATYRKKIALHLFDPQEDDEAGAQAALEFRKKLDEFDIRYSVGRPLAGSAQQWSVDEGYWIAAPRHRVRSAGTPSGKRLVFVNRPPGADNTGWLSESPLEPGVAVVLSAGAAGRCGLDDRLSLHVAVLLNMSSPPQFGIDHSNPVEPTGEGVIVVGPGAIATAAQRIEAIRRLRKLADSGVVQFVPLDEFSISRLPDDPVLPNCLQAARFQATRDSILQSGRRRDEDLMLDAAAAWKYFKRGTNPKTGLCASTTVRGEPASGYASATMWEVGSQINALIAALGLGLIDDDDFKSRTRAIIRAIERTVAKGRILPPEWVDTRTGRSSRNFNSFDTGRFLLALDRLRKHRLAPNNIEMLVGDWDFGTILLNRRLHSIRDGKLVDDYNSLYSEYAAAGFRAWGFDVTSPFEPLQNVATPDQQMALLYTVARIGPIGAEPVLLELVDKTESPAADYLSDLLFAAQLDLHRRTGLLVFPSETPLDRPPWFAFQGYSVEVSDNPWSVKFDSSEPEFQTEEFLRSARANSSKAAYLWHAMRPSQASQLMVERTRKVARSDFGFLSAIYVESGSPTQMYSDLNTNSVILQSIALMS